MNELSVATSLAAFDDIRDEIESFCESRRLPPKTAFSLQLVLEELLVNVVNHGYGGRPGPVRLNLESDGTSLTGQVVDEGRPFDPTAAADVDVDAPMDERGVGGLGIHLVKSMVDTFDYERRGDANVVRFTMRIPENHKAGEAD